MKIEAVKNKTPSMVFLERMNALCENQEKKLMVRHKVKGEVVTTTAKREDIHFFDDFLRIVDGDKDLNIDFEFLVDFEV